MIREFALVAQTVKESACNAGDLGSIPGSGRSPGVGDGNPLQYSCMENSMDRGAWQVIYSPWSYKQSDTTERLTRTHTHTHTSVFVFQRWALGLQPECMLMRKFSRALDRAGTGQAGKTNSLIRELGLWAR